MSSIKCKYQAKNALRILVVAGLAMNGAEVVVWAENSNFNLGPPEAKELRINGKDYSFYLSKYDPPYAHTKPIDNQNEQDLATLEGTDLAIQSSVGRDWDWYLSLHDEGSKIIERKFMAENPDVLPRWNKSAPPPNNLKEQEFYHELEYKIDLEFNGKHYAIISHSVIGPKGKFGPSMKRFIQRDGAWLVTNDDFGPFDWIASELSYADLQEVLKNGVWQTPGYVDPAPIKAILKSSKPAYQIGEPLEFVLTIENVGKNKVSLVNGLGPDGRGWILMFSWGDRIRGFVNFSETNFTSKDYDTLDPGESKTTACQITDYSNTDSSMGEAVPVGEIKVEAIYNPNPLATQSPSAPQGLLDITDFSDDIKTEPIMIHITEQSEVHRQPDASS